ncbi:MAG TPA: hypothetical protein GXZ89_08230 [Fastidiosipila sp.]|jgi:hypothetical protein|nr:hypothetical protein [Fastidiosipila sp.]
MLPEFIAGTAISIILLVLLLWLLIKRLAVNRNKANRVAAFYLLPVVITLVLIGVFVFLVFPRVMDVPYVLADNYEVIEADIDESMLVRTGLSVNGRHLFMPSRALPKPGTSVRLFVTPHAGYVMRMDTLVNEASDP